MSAILILARPPSNRQHSRKKCKMATLAVAYANVPTTPVKYAFTAVVVSAVIMAIARPDAFYDPRTGALRNFGTAPHETIFPAWMGMLCVGYLAYMLAASVKLASCCKLE